MEGTLLEDARSRNEARRKGPPPLSPPYLSSPSSRAVPPGRIPPGKVRITTVPEYLYPPRRNTKQQTFRTLPGTVPVPIFGVISYSGYSAGTFLGSQGGYRVPGRSQKPFPTLSSMRNPGVRYFEVVISDCQVFPNLLQREPPAQTYATVVTFTVMQVWHVWLPIPATSVSNRDLKHGPYSYNCASVASAGL